MLLANPRTPTPQRRGVSLLAPGVSITSRLYRAAMPTDPDTERAAQQMGVDPDQLDKFLAAADLEPPRDDQKDDLPKLLARLEES